MVSHVSLRSSGDPMCSRDLSRGPRRVVSLAALNGGGMAYKVQRQIADNLIWLNQRR